MNNGLLGPQGPRGPSYRALKGFKREKKMKEMSKILFFHELYMSYNVVADRRQHNHSPQNTHLHSHTHADLFTLTHTLTHIYLNSRHLKCTLSLWTHALWMD